MSQHASPRVLSLKNPLKTPAKQLLLTFDVDVLGVQGKGCKATLTGGSRNNTARSVVVNFNKEVSVGSTVELAVRLEKGVATEHRRIWLSDKGPVEKPFTNAMKKRRKRLLSYMRPPKRPRFDKRLPKKPRFDKRPPKKPRFDLDMAWFFLRLDELTLPQLLFEREKGNSMIARRRHAIIAVNAHLRGRLDMRAWNTNYGLRFTRELRDYDRNVADATKLERLLRPLLTSYLAKRLKKSPRRRPEGVFRDLFVSFVVGKLADERHPDATGTFGAPDGVQFLHFAEFALLCRPLLEERRGEGEAGARRNPKWGDLWRPVFRALVVAADVFAHVYWNGGPRVDSSYTWQCHVASKDFLRAVRQRHAKVRADVDVVDLFGRIAAQVLRDVHPKDYFRQFVVQDALRPE